MYRLSISIAVFGFALQNTLYAKYARALNGITLVIIRNVSLIAVGTIALFRVRADQYAQAITYWQPITRTALLGVSHLILNYEAYNYLPVGTANVLKKGVATITGFIIGYVLLGEQLHIMQYLLISAVVIFCLLLANKKSSAAHLEHTSHRKGIAFLSISGILSTAAWYGFKQYADHLNPFLASYLLEASVGVMSLIVLPIYTWYSGSLFQKATSRQLMQITIISFVTIFSTIAYTYALQSGLFSLSNALVICSLPVVCVLGAFLYQEHLSRKQIILISIIIVCLISLKFVS